MQRARGAFVREGDPAVEGQVTWPRFRPDGGVLSLQVGGHSTVLPLRAISASHNCSFWDEMR